MVCVFDLKSYSKKANGAAVMTDLRKAVELIKNGQKTEARRIVLQALSTDQDNIKAWLCLTRCAVNRDQFDISVRNVLRLDPTNTYARNLAQEHHVELYRNVTATVSKTETEEDAARKAKDVDDALEHIEDVLEPVRSAQRRHQPRLEQQTERADTYMNPRRRQTLQFLLTIGFLAVGGIVIVLAVLYFDSVQGDLSVSEQETQTVLENEAATAFRENTLSVATVAVRATVFAGTETAIAIENTIIAEASIAFIGANRIEARNNFTPDEPIGLSYTTGQQVDAETPLRIQVFSDENETLVKTEDILLGTGRRNVRIQPPESGWPIDVYRIVLSVDNRILLELNATIDSGN